MGDLCRRPTSDGGGNPESDKEDEAGKAIRHGSRLKATPATIIEQTKGVMLAIVRIVKREAHWPCIEYI